MTKKNVTAVVANNKKKIGFGLLGLGVAVAGGIVTYRVKNKTTA